MDNNMTYICDTCKKKSDATERQSKYYCRVSSLEASFKCVECSNSFSMAFEVTYRKPSSIVEFSTSYRMEYEMSDKELDQATECPKSFGMTHEMTDELIPGTESCTSFREASEVTDEEYSPNVEYSTSFNMANGIANKELPSEEGKEDSSISRLPKILIRLRSWRRSQ